MRVENMNLLVPTVDNKEERIFYLTQVEALAQSSPLISAVVRAQEAAHRVGYASPTQFSREYRRMFGVTPATDRSASPV